MKLEQPPIIAILSIGGDCGYTVFYRSLAKRLLDDQPPLAPVVLEFFPESQIAIVLEPRVGVVVRTSRCAQAQLPVRLKGEPLSYSFEEPFEFVGLARVQLGQVVNILYCSAVRGAEPFQIEVGNLATDISELMAEQHDHRQTATIGIDVREEFHSFPS